MNGNGDGKGNGQEDFSRQNVPVAGEAVIKLDSISYKVRSQDGAAWHIVRWANGRWHCDCTGFQYRKTCRHVKAVQELQRGFGFEQIAVERTEDFIRRSD